MYFVFAWCLVFGWWENEGKQREIGFFLFWYVLWIYTWFWVYFFVFAWCLGAELLPFVVDGSLVLVFVLCFFPCVALYFVLKTESVLVLLFLLVVVLLLSFNNISVWCKKNLLLSFFFIAFVSHILNTKTQPNRTEIKCNRSVWRPFLTSQF